MLNFAAIAPHPPVMIPSIGKGQTMLLNQTIQAMEQLSLELKKSEPHTLVVISPHGPMRYDKFTINLNETFKGSFQNFGDYDSLESNYLNNNSLSELINHRFRKKHFPTEVIREQALDYGSLVPLHYLDKNLEKKTHLLDRFLGGKYNRGISCINKYQTTIYSS